MPDDLIEQKRGGVDLVGSVPVPLSLKFEERSHERSCMGGEKKIIPPTGQTIGLQPTEAW